MFLRKITKLQKLKNYKKILGKFTRKDKVPFVSFSCLPRFLFIFSQTKWTSKYNNFEIDSFKLPSVGTQKLKTRKIKKHYGIT